MVKLPTLRVNGLRNLTLSGIRAPVWGCVLALASIGLNFVPLFNLLGYDFSFAIGLITAFAAVDVGHGVVHHVRRCGVVPTPDVPVLVARAVLLSLALLILPLLISSVNALRVRNCSFASGMAFYALLPVGTALFAAPAGVVAALAFPRFGRAAALSMPIITIIWSGVRMYTSPPVYAMDPFGGYFPGPIYDEALSPPHRLWHFRLSNLVWIAGVVAVASVLTEQEGQQAPRLRASRLFTKLRQLRVDQGAALLVVCLAATTAYAFGGALGFHRTHGELREELSRTHRTAHFEVHSSPSDGQTPAEVELFLDELEFRYEQLKHILATEPQLPVTVYLFPTAESKKDLVGAGATLFTKPWRQEIYLQVDAFPQHHLRHELAHIFASSFGDPVFGISLRWLPFPRLASGLVEGVAEAADFGNPSGSATLHQDARSIIDLGRSPALASIVGAGFSAIAGPQAYTLAASFCHFLLANHGPQKFQMLYRTGGAFDRVYGQSLAALEQQWRDFLQQQPLNSDQRATAKERYRRPAIFEKVCARDLAARVSEANGLRSYEPGRAVKLLQGVCEDDPSEPTYQLSLAYAQAAAGQANAAGASLAQLEARDELTKPLRRKIFTFRSTLAYFANNDGSAIEAELQALELATEDADRRSSSARLRALADPQARATLGRVLFGDRVEEGLDVGLSIYLLSQFERTFPNEALGAYMVGRQLVSRDPRSALERLERACPSQPGQELPIPLSPTFLRECLRMRGESGYRAGAFAAATAAWGQARGLGQSEADRLRADDFLKRIAWKQARALASN